MHEDHERWRAIAELRELVDVAENSGVNLRQVPEIMAAVENRLRGEGRVSAGD